MPDQRTAEYKITLKSEDREAVENTMLSARRARELGINRAAAHRAADDSVRYRTVFIEARNAQRARTLAIEENAGWFVLDCEPRTTL
jgi:hypothetical protein